MVNEREGRPLTKSEFETLLFYAEKDLIKRFRKEVSESREGPLIILNAVLPDSYIRPRKYENSHTPDVLVATNGLFKVLFFDDKGAVTDTVLVSRGDSPQTVKAVEIPADTWHTVVALTRCAFVETKGEVVREEIFALWAPKEGTPEGLIYLEELREVKVVDKEKSQG